MSGTGNDTLRAAFTYAVRYQVHAACQTPLRTGGTDGDTELVLTDSRGQPIIQGSSLAGAMRAWVQQTCGTSMANALFGTQKGAGRLIVSEGRFHGDFVQSVRPRLKIDPKTGNAEDKKKFDLAQINAGARFLFTLTWLGQGENRAEQAVLEKTLSALHNGAIRLGGQKSNGFGRVSLTVEKQTYDMMQEKDRTDWLQERENLTPLTLPPFTERPHATFTLTGTADSILVKSAAVEYDEEGHSFTRNLMERNPDSANGAETADEGIPILPGSSVKGAVRAQAERIARRTGREGLVETLFGRGSAAKDGGQGTPKANSSGEKDNGQAGRLLFEDVKLEKARPRKITRIHINRFTGGVIRTGTFTEEPLSSKVTLTITAPADCPEGCALLLYALRDLGLGLYHLGSGGAIGRGYLRVETLTARSGDRKATLTFPEGGGCTVSDPNGLVAEWMKAWKEAAQ